MNLNFVEYFHILKNYQECIAGHIALLQQALSSLDTTIPEDILSSVTEVINDEIQLLEELSSDILQLTIQVSNLYIQQKCDSGTIKLTRRIHITPNFTSFVREISYQCELVLSDLTQHAAKMDQWTPADRDSIEFCIFSNHTEQFINDIHQLRFEVNQYKYRESILRLNKCREKDISSIMETSPESSSVKEVSAPNIAYDETIYFSVSSTPSLTIAEYHVISIYCFLKAFQSMVEDIISKQTGHEIIKQSSGFSIPETSNITITLSSPSTEVEIEENTITFSWNHQFASSDFFVRVSESYTKQTVPFKVLVDIDGTPLTKLLFVLHLENPSPQKIEVHQVAMRIFASYSSQDCNAVLYCIEGMQKISPNLDIFLDSKNLRSGDDWQEALQKEIVASDKFYLFWSSAAAKSEHVNWELNVALKEKDNSFIDPIPLEPPHICPPPNDLSSKHFDDWTLYFQKRNPNSK